MANFKPDVPYELKQVCVVCLSTACRSLDEYGECTVCRVKTPLALDYKVIFPRTQPAVRADTQYHGSNYYNSR